MVIRCEKCHKYNCIVLKELEDIKWIKDRRKKTYGYGFQKVRFLCPACKHTFVSRAMYYPKF